MLLKSVTWFPLENETYLKMPYLYLRQSLKHSSNKISGRKWINNETQFKSFYNKTNELIVMSNCKLHTALLHLQVF